MSFLLHATTAIISLLLTLGPTTATPIPQLPHPLPATWGAYLCPDPGFHNSSRVQSYCTWTNWALMESMPPNRCIYSTDDKSVGPDPGVLCELYEFHSNANNCWGRVSPTIQYPGVRDVEAWTAEKFAGPAVYWTGYRCWLAEPIGS